MIPHFTTRAEYIVALEESLLPKVSPGRKVFVLYGLGGIGKTQLAIKFAKDHQKEFNSVFFLDGSSQDSLFKSFAAIFRRIAESKTLGNKDSVNLATNNQIPPQAMAEKAMQWLAHQSNNRWLLIFDNIDKEPSDEGGFDIMPFFPPKDHGSILITTRLAPLSKLGHSKKVGRMSDEEADKLLDECLGESVSCRQGGLATHNREALTRHALLKTLDGLPLAISQAGRFINALNLRLETYLELYSSSKREVMDMLSSDSQLQDSEKGSIRTTWTTSLNLLKEKASKQGPNGDYYAAHSLLQLFAYFETSDLRYDIIKFGLIGNDIPDWFRRTFSSKIRFFSVIKILLDLCLVDNNISEGSYSMHRVVHDWLCTYVSVGADLELLRLASAAISYSAPLYWTRHWVDEQQQLALHAVHIHQSLRNLSPGDFLVQYDKLTAPELSMVSYLLDEPVKCWTLKKFDYTLLGIARLLQSCGKSREALRLTQDTLSRCPENLDDGTPNPIHALLRYVEIACHETSNLHACTDALIHNSETFNRLGSPSWAVIAQNLRALYLEGLGIRSSAVKTWELILDQSWHHTGSVFTHPTSMVFANLEHRIRYDPRLRKDLFQKFEEDARRERRKLRRAGWLLNELKKMRSGGVDGRDILMTRKRSSTKSWKRMIS